jgi:hypothetical protein
MPSNSLDAITRRWTARNVKPAKSNKKPRFRGAFWIFRDDPELRIGAEGDSFSSIKLLF